MNLIANKARALNLRAAWLIADTTARLVSLFRPLQYSSELVYPESLTGSGSPYEITERDTFVIPLSRLTLRAWLRAGIWVSRTEKEACLAIRALGCLIEVYFIPRARAAS